MVLHLWNYEIFSHDVDGISFFFFKKKNKKRTLTEFGKVLLLYILKILNIFNTHKEGKGNLKKIDSSIYLKLSNLGERKS